MKYLFTTVNRKNWIILSQIVKIGISFPHPCYRMLVFINSCFFHMNTSYIINSLLLFFIATVSVCIIECKTLITVWIWRILWNSYLWKRFVWSIMTEQLIEVSVKRTLCNLDNKCIWLTSGRVRDSMNHLTYSTIQFLCVPYSTP